MHAWNSNPTQSEELLTAPAPTGDSDPVRFEEPGPNEAKWCVCHTKPRCEKRLADAFRRYDIEHYLPLVPSMRNYGRRTKRFHKPLFPGYVFGRIRQDLPRRADLLEHLVRRLTVEDQGRFLAQLQAIHRTLLSNHTVSLHPLIKQGTRVVVNAGSLRGLEGVVDDPDNPKGVVVSVDFLQQGVLVQIPPEALKIVPD